MSWRGQPHDSWSAYVGALAQQEKRQSTKACLHDSTPQSGQEQSSNAVEYLQQPATAGLRGPKDRQSGAAEQIPGATSESCFAQRRKYLQPADPCPASQNVHVAPQPNKDVTWMAAEMWQLRQDNTRLRAAVEQSSTATVHGCALLFRVAVYACQIGKMSIVNDSVILVQECAWHARVPGAHMMQRALMSNKTSRSQMLASGEPQHCSRCTTMLAAHVLVGLCRLELGCSSIFLHLASHHDSVCKRQAQEPVAVDNMQYGHNSRPSVVLDSVVLISVQSIGNRASVALADASAQRKRACAMVSVEHHCTSSTCRCICRW